MGEALIVRRGGSGGGDLSLEVVERKNTGNTAVTSSVLDSTATYLVSVYGAVADSEDVMKAHGGLCLLKNGVLSIVCDGGNICNGVSFDSTANRLTIDCPTSEDYRRYYDYIYATIIKVN